MVASEARERAERHRQGSELDVDVRGDLRVVARSWPLRFGLVVAQLALASAFLVFLLAPSSHAEDPLVRIQRGEAEVVLGELDRVPVAARSARDELVRGVALSVVGRETEAFAAWIIAVRGGAVHDIVRTAAVTRLASDEPSAAVAIVRSWPDDTIVPPLVALASTGAWLARHRALALLEERGALESIDVEAFAIRDLSEGDSCTRRKDGLEMLRRYGKTTSALDALREAARRDDGCLRRLMPAIEGALRVRLGVAPKRAAEAVPR